MIEKRRLPATTYQAICSNCGALSTFEVQIQPDGDWADKLLDFCDEFYEY